VKQEPPVSPKAFNITSSTSNATVAATSLNVPVYLTVGQTLRFGTTNLPGASTTADTFIRLFGVDLVEVASNDDFDPGNDILQSYLEYTATATGVHTMRIGCYGSSTGSGTFAWQIV
jgi:hypothetical protein